MATLIGAWVGGALVLVVAVFAAVAYLRRRRLAARRRQREEELAWRRDHFGPPHYPRDDQQAEADRWLERIEDDRKREMRNSGHS